MSGIVGRVSVSYGCSSDAMRIKIARSSVRWLSSAESHERANAVRSLLRLWLPVNQIAHFKMTKNISGLFHYTTI